jgi:hypothetical protein
VVNFGLRFWVLGIRHYFFICDNMHLSPIYQLKGGVGRTLDPLNPRNLESFLNWEVICGTGI